MKKLLSILVLTTISSTSLPINFANSNISKINNYNHQNDLKKNSSIKTMMKKHLSNNEEEIKKYLIDSFDDLNLINKIKFELSSIVQKDNKGYFIYQNDVNNIVSLDLSSSDITSFKGLDFFSNLISLNVSNNNQKISLSDFQLIFNKLEVFDVSYNRIEHIDNIMYFHSLKELYISNMTMEKNFIWETLFLPLSRITTLTRLDLHYNKNIFDISLLGNLINLTNLDLGYNNVSDVSVLANLTSLTNLNLWENNVSDISVLTNLTSLTSLGLNGNNVSDVSVLANLTSLTYLYLIDNNVSNISVLSNLTNLIYLDLSGNNVSDVSVLTNLTSLTYLYLSDNNVSDVSVLANLTNLIYLDLSGNNVSDISVLANLINLTNLDLSDNNVSDIFALSNLTKLTDLNLTSNRIPKTNEAWAVLHQLPYYDSSWDNESVRNSQK